MPSSNCCVRNPHWGERQQRIFTVGEFYSRPWPRQVAVSNRCTWHNSIQFSWSPDCVWIPWPRIAPCNSRSQKGKYLFTICCHVWRKIEGGLFQQKIVNSAILFCLFLLAKCNCTKQTKCATMSKKGWGFPEVGHLKTGLLIQSHSQRPLV